LDSKEYAAPKSKLTSAFAAIKRMKAAACRTGSAYL
jgi:hypothetical protein